MLDRTKAPETKIISDIKVDKVDSISLKNGIPLYYYSGGSQDVVRIELIFPAGNRFQQKSLQASYTSKLLTLGTKNRSAKEIAEALEYYGAYLDCENDKDFGTIELLTLSKYLSDVLPILRDVLTETVFPEKELEIQLQAGRQNHSINLGKVDYLCRAHFNNKLFGNDHPYGRMIEDSDYDRISKAELSDFYRNNYDLSQATLFVSGKVTDEILNKIEEELGGFELKKSEISIGEYNTSSEMNTGFYPIFKEGALQTGVRVGRKMMNKSHQDFIPFQVLNTLLGGYFGSRLMGNIREDKGFTYGIGSALVAMQHEGWFFITSEVKGNSSKDTLTEIKKEMDILKKDLVSKDELELVKNYLIGGMLKKLDGPFAKMDSFKGVKFFDLEMDYYLKMIEGIKSITPEHVKELAQKYLNWEEMLVVCAGDPKNLEDIKF